jgi:hypothetical protein
MKDDARVAQKFGRLSQVEAKVLCGSLGAAALGKV